MKTFLRNYEKNYDYLYNYEGNDFNIEGVREAINYFDYLLTDKEKDLRNDFNKYRKMIIITSDREAAAFILTMKGVDLTQPTATYKAIIKNLITTVSQHYNNSNSQQ